jgi:hypothetical protein
VQLYAANGEQQVKEQVQVGVGEVRAPAEEVDVAVEGHLLHLRVQAIVELEYTPVELQIALEHVDRASKRVLKSTYLEGGQVL